MQGKGYLKAVVSICVAAGFLFLRSNPANGQEIRSAPSSPSSSSSSAEAPAEINALTELIRGLQAQVQSLNSQLGELRTQQEQASAESRELRHELELLKSQGTPAPGGPLNTYSAPPAKESAAQAAPASSSPTAPESQTPEDRISKLEEEQQLMEGKINDQYQTKVESGSKYRLRLSGILLLNLFENRGIVDNEDFPSYAETAQSNEPFVSPGMFGGTLRQSQIRLQAFGPDLAGAHTSADINLDFAGGFTNTWDGSVMGLPRMRTAVARLDWTNTSIVAGQDRLFFVPLSPTSLASVATPPLTYAGNLWAWTPQLRVEHRFVMSDASSFSIQGGILDNLTGDYPVEDYDRYPSWGELSGQPAYATRISWSHRIFDQDFTIGAGGYYSRQDWGYSRNVDGWAGTVDLTLPLGKRFEFTSAFYRGRAVAGLGGGIGQSVLLNGPFSDPSTTFRGLDSIGGWGQLKFKLRSNFEINGALGSDNPFAGELRQYNAPSSYPGLYTRNLSPLVNFIYQIRSDILFSTEYRHLNSTLLDSGSINATQINLSLGYIF